MPTPIADAVTDAGKLATVKYADSGRTVRYLLASALAGAYVGVAVVLLLSVGGPLVAADSPVARLVFGAVFGIALALVVFAGAELFTGNVMTMLFGTFDRRVRWSELTLVWVVSLLGNFVGSVLFGLLVHAGGTLTIGGSDGEPAPGEALVASLVASKDAASGGQLFARAILCNMLVCLALWMAARATTDGAKLLLLWWPLFAFISSGFEHCVANMTIYTLAIADGTASFADMLRNLAWTVPGNIVGGGLLVAGAYWFIVRGTERAPDMSPTTP